MTDSENRIVRELKSRMVLTRDKMKYHAEKALFHIERCHALDNDMSTYKKAIAVINEINGVKPEEETAH